MRSDHITLGGRAAMAVLACALLLGLASSAWAVGPFFINPRALGMGGARTASVDDTSAQYYNPAAFGFFGCKPEMGEKFACDNQDLGRKDWGVDVYAGAGAAVLNNMGEYLDELSEIDIDSLNDNGIQDESDIADLLKALNLLDRMDDPDNALKVDANAGMGVRVGNFGMGARGYMEIGARTNNGIDTANLGISTPDGDINAEIQSGTPSGWDSQTALFSADQQAQLSAAGLDATSISILDYQARQEGLSGDELQGTVDLLADLTNATSGGGGDIGNNQTTVLARGFGLAEFPITYGYAINENFAVGGSVKLMYGRVYGALIQVFDAGSEQVVEDAREDFEETYNVGLDFGAMARFKWIQLGLMGRNLNSPEFDGPEVTHPVTGLKYKIEDVEVEPQVTAGVALIPFETLTIEADVELLESETVIDGYHSQYLSAGVEWDVLRFLALRAGFYTNLAEDDIGLIYTAGAGLNLWAVRFDVAGAFSEKTAQYDGEEIPQEVRLALGLSMDF